MHQHQLVAPHSSTPRPAQPQATHTTRHYAQPTHATVTMPPCSHLGPPLRPALTEKSRGGRREALADGLPPVRAPPPRPRPRPQPVGPMWLHVVGCDEGASAVGQEVRARHVAFTHVHSRGARGAVAQRA